MATVTFTENAEFIYGYAYLGNRYEASSVSPTKLTLSLVSGDSPDEYPTTVEMSLTGVEFYVPASGPNAGSPVVSGGSVTRIDYLDENGDLVVQITDIDLSAVLVSAWVEEGELFRFYRYVVQGGSTFIGSDTFSDILTGPGDDEVFAGTGGSYIKDAGGADTYIGNTGYDTLTYDEWFYNPVGQIQGITVNYTSQGSGFVDGPDGFQDSFSSIEAIRGTMLDDTFNGATGEQSFMGLAGNDVFNGRAGIDFVRYDRDFQFGGTAGVIVDLSTTTGTARDGFGTTDTLTGIEGVRGTEQGDVMIDNAGADNSFRGLGGADLFVFSGGNNFVNGGDGADEYRIVSGAQGTLFIEDFDANGDFLRLEGVSNLGQLSVTDSASGLEILVQNQFEIFLEGVRLADVSLANLELGPA